MRYRTGLNVAHPEDSHRARDVKKTLAYGRIITSTNAEAIRLVTDLAEKARPSATAGEITEFIRAGIREEEAEFLAARHMQAQAAERLLVDFDALAQYQNTLSRLTKELAELEMPPSPKVRLSQMEAIGRAVLAQLKKKPTKDQGDDAPAAP